MESPHHEHVEPVCEKPTPTASQQSRARENNSQPRPQPARKHCLQDLLGKKATTDVGSAQFAAMTEQLKLAKRTADYLLRISNVPNELMNKRGNEFDLKEGGRQYKKHIKLQCCRPILSQIRLRRGRQRLMLPWMRLRWMPNFSKV